MLFVAWTTSLLIDCNDYARSVQTAVSQSVVQGEVSGLPCAGLDYSQVASWRASGRAEARSTGTLKSTAFRPVDISLAVARFAQIQSTKGYLPHCAPFYPLLPPRGVLNAASNRGRPVCGQPANVPTDNAPSALLPTPRPEVASVDFFASADPSTADRCCTVSEIEFDEKADK